LLTILLLKVVHNGHDLRHARLLMVALITEPLIKTLNIQWVQFAATNANNISISPILPNFQHVHVRMEGTDKKKYFFQSIDFFDQYLELWNEIMKKFFKKMLFR